MCIWSASLDKTFTFNGYASRRRTKRKRQNEPQCSKFHRELIFPSEYDLCRAEGTTAQSVRANERRGEFVAARNAA